MRKTILLSVIFFLVFPLFVAYSGETDGFSYDNVHFKKSSSNYIEIIGEITNHSGRSYQMVSFTLSVYDDSGNLLDTAPIVISNFRDGQTKSFSTIVQASYDELSRYKIDFENSF